MIETPAKHTIFKALLYTFGTSVLATILYRVLLRRGGSGGGSSRFTFLSVFLKPLQFIFKDLEHNETKIIPFEDKYFNEYDDWQKRQQQQQQQEQQDTTSATEAEQQHRKECLENMYYSTVRETIDDFYGDVIMCYDHATLSFAYYARTANIPYKYLETISRKYMIETNAPREIHVDIRDEYNKAKNRTATTAASSSTTSTASSSASSSTASSTATEETPDVFVKLKTYNTASNLNLHTTTNETTNKIHKYVAGTEGPPTGPEGQPTGTAGTTGPAAGTTNKIFREKANRYSYRGKIADFDVNHKTFLADRRAATAATADTATTAAAAADTAADTAATTGYAEFKKQWMT